MTDTKLRGRTRRRLIAGAAFLVFALLLSIAALPWLLSSAPARRWLLARANKVLAPGRLEIDSIRFSWFGPVRLRRFVIRDHQGDRVVDAPTATWDRRLFQVLFDRPRYGTLRLEGGAVQLERLKDGSIDLVETLKPILGPDPRVDLRIELRRGKLELHDRIGQLAEPVTAERADLDVHIASAPRPLTWALNLASGAGANEAAVSMIGRFARWTPTAEGYREIAVKVRSRRWPLHARNRELDVQGRLTGAIEAFQHDGFWEVVADETSVDLNAQGSLLAGDRIAWTDATAKVRVRQSPAGWSFEAFDVRTPIGTLRAKGSSPKSRGISHIEGELDLAAVAQQLPHMVQLPRDLAIRSGSARAVVQARVEGQTTSWSVDGSVENLQAVRAGETVAFQDPGHLRGRILPDDGSGRTGFEAVLEAGSTPWTDGPMRLSVSGEYSSADHDLELAKLEFAERRVRLSAHGRIKALHSEREVSLAGTLAPDWDEVNRTLAERVEPGAYVRGKEISFEVAGPLRGSWSELTKSWNAALSLEILEADVYGLEVGRTTIAARSQRGQLVIDPVDTTLNGGTVHLEPTLTADDAGAWTLALTDQSTIEGAEVNDEVSHRFLAYVVPVMDKATRVRGKVSVDFDRATFPIGEGASQKAVVEGDVVFSDVEFAPGPLAADLLGMLGRHDLPSLKLNQPVVLAIHDGMVHQHGLAIPIGKLTQIEIAGTVDFDRNLDLKASLPISSAMFGEGGLLADIVDGTKLDVPIRGTLAAPKIDKDAFRLALRDMGKGLLERGVTRGAAELLFRLTQPRDPNAPPAMRLTPQERRERRQERREERRARRQRP